MVANRQEASAAGAAAPEEAAAKAVDRADEKTVARRRALRRFGLVVGGVFAALAVLLALRHRFNLSFRAFTAAGLILIVLALVAPSRLDPVERIWMKFGAMMGWINTRVLLAAVFFVVLTPVSLLLRVLGRDLLKRRFERSAPSYWQERSADDSGVDKSGAREGAGERYKRQY